MNQDKSIFKKTVSNVLNDNTYFFWITFFIYMGLNLLAMYLFKLTIKSGNIFKQESFILGDIPTYIYNLIIMTIALFNFSRLIIFEDKNLISLKNILFFLIPILIVGIFFSIFLTFNFGTDKKYYYEIGVNLIIFLFVIAISIISLITDDKVIKAIPAICSLLITLFCLSYANLTPDQTKTVILLSAVFIGIMFLQKKIAFKFSFDKTKFDSKKTICIFSVSIAICNPFIFAFIILPILAKHLPKIILNLNKNQSYDIFKSYIDVLLNIFIVICIYYIIKNNILEIIFMPLKSFVIT